MSANLETSAVATCQERSVFIPIPKKGNAKECANYCTIALISYISKVMLKILQARLQQYMNRELSDVQAHIRKGRGSRDQIANIHWIIEKASSVQFSHSVVSDSLQPHELQHASIRVFANESALCIRWPKCPIILEFYIVTN